MTAPSDKPASPSPSRSPHGASLVGALLGGALCYVLSFSLLVDEIGRIGHRIFWNAVFEGKLREEDISKVLQSETFWKIAIPVLVGLVAGAHWGGKWGQQKNAGSS